MKDSESANVTVQLERPRTCPYSPVLEWGNGNETRCQRVRMVPIATREWEHLLRFICHNLPLNARFMLKVFADRVSMDMTFLPVCKYKSYKVFLLWSLAPDNLAIPGNSRWDIGGKWLLLLHTLATI